MILRRSTAVALSTALWWLQLQCAVVHAFVPMPPSSWTTTTSDDVRTRTARLFYRNNPPDDELPPSASVRMVIPVLGPFPGQPPVLVGGEFLLNQPTPGQWQALEEAVTIHRQGMASADKQQQITASIDAAPLVALLDDYTATADVQGGRYATLCAVVGISSSTSSNDGLLTDSSTSFMESFARIRSSSNKQTRPLDSKIRLVGIGRASLGNSFYQRPSSQLLDDDDEESVEPEEEPYHDDDMVMDRDEHLDEVDDDEEDRPTSNIIMSTFTLLLDSNQRSNKDKRRVPSKRASPIHAVMEMSNLANRLGRLHRDRQRYLAGLQAAKARLEFLAINNDVDSSADMDDLEDYDGLGMLASNREYEEELEESQATIDSMLVAPNDSSSRPLEHTRLVEMENYGMGFTSAAVSGLSDLANVWLEKLSPYYSPSRCETEEHYFELVSFVALLSLQTFLEPYNQGKALRCTNTIERLEMAYEWMWDHVRLLKLESEKMSQELRECGDECTDLW